MVEYTTMSITTTLLFVVAVVLYHEAGHFVASELFGVTKGFGIAYHTKWTHRLFAFGPAVLFNNETLNGGETWAILLAPLLWIFPAGIAFAIGNITNVEGLYTGSLIMAAAALFVLLSDLPMHYFGFTTDEDMKIWYLWRSQS